MRWRIANRILFLTKLLRQRKAKSDTHKQQLLAKVNVDEAFSSSAEESCDSRDVTDELFHKANNSLTRK